MVLRASVEDGANASDVPNRVGKHLRRQEELCGSGKCRKPRPDDQSIRAKSCKPGHRRRADPDIKRGVLCGVNPACPNGAVAAIQVMLERP